MNREVTIPGSAATALNVDERHGVEVIRTRRIGSGVLVTLSITRTAIQGCIDDVAELAEGRGAFGEKVSIDSSTRRACKKCLPDLVGAKASMEEERDGRHAAQEREEAALLAAKNLTHEQRLMNVRERGLFDRDQTDVGTLLERIGDMYHDPVDDEFNPLNHELDAAYEAARYPEAVQALTEIAKDDALGLLEVIGEAAGPKLYHVELAAGVAIALGLDTDEARERYARAGQFEALLTASGRAKIVGEYEPMIALHVEARRMADTKGPHRKSGRIAAEKLRHALVNEHPNVAPEPGQLVQRPAPPAGTVEMHVMGGDGYEAACEERSYGDPHLDDDEHPGNQNVTARGAARQAYEIAQAKANDAARLNPAPRNLAALRAVASRRKKAWDALCQEAPQPV